MVVSPTNSTCSSSSSTSSTASDERPSFLLHSPRSAADGGVSKKRMWFVILAGLLTTVLISIDSNVGLLVATTKITKDLLSSSSSTSSSSTTFKHHEDDDASIVMPSSSSSYCPLFPSLRNGTWQYTPNTQTWTWTRRQEDYHDPSKKTNNTTAATLAYRATKSAEQANRLRKSAWSSSLVLAPSSSSGTTDDHTNSQNNNGDISLVMYGSSHTRALYHSLYRLAEGQPFNSEIPDQIRHMASGEKWQDVACDPTGAGFNKGKFGIDLEACGPPTIRRIPELGNNIVMGFKTYLHTPLAENLLLQILEEENLRHPHVLLVDVALWGTRGQRMGNLTEFIMEPEEELDYYMNWLNTTFPHSIIVAAVDEVQGYPKALLQQLMVAALERAAQLEPQRWILFRKDHLLAERPTNMPFPCGHGCAGPVTHVMALLFNEWLMEARSQGCWQQHHQENHNKP